MRKKSVNLGFRLRIKILSLFIFLVVYPSLVSLCAEDEYDSGSSTVYIVKKGDTLYSIGRRFGVGLNELVSVNHIQNPSRIRVGQSITIPSRFVRAPVQTLPSRQVESVTSPQQPEELYEPELVEAGPILTAEEESPRKVREYSSGRPKREIFGGGFGWWFGFLDAQAKISENDIIGTDIDLVDDLGVDESVGIPVINLWVQPLSWLRIQGEYMTAGIEGSREIDEDITFNGETFSISDTVRGELDIQRFSGWVEINPLRGSWGYLGAMVGGEYVRLEGELSSELVGTTSATLDAGTLTLGGQGVIHMTDQLAFRGRIRGMSFEVSDIAIDVFDFQAGLSYTFLEHIELSADYRYLILDVEEEENSGDLTLQGPVLSALIKF